MSLKESKKPPNDRTNRPSYGAYQKEFDNNSFVLEMHNRSIERDFGCSSLQFQSKSLFPVLPAESRANQLLC